jgi:hypothetical protein
MASFMDPQPRNAIRLLIAPSWQFGGSGAETQKELLGAELCKTDSQRTPMLAAAGTQVGALT